MVGASCNDTGGDAVAEGEGEAAMGDSFAVPEEREVEATHVVGVFSDVSSLTILEGRVGISLERRWQRSFFFFMVVGSWWVVEGIPLGSKPLHWGSSMFSLGVLSTVCRVFFFCSVHMPSFPLKSGKQVEACVFPSVLSEVFLSVLSWEGVCEGDSGKLTLVGGIFIPLC